MEGQASVMELETEEEQRAGAEPTGIKTTSAKLETTTVEQVERKTTMVEQAEQKNTTM